MSPGPVSESGLPGWVAVAPASRRLVELARRTADRAATVLVTGETGTGKGRLARAIHDAGEHPEAPFVVISCASLPEALAESELFGHEADAFSGASGRRLGRFELAKGGTVLLERVEDLSLAVQGKLLRVLQERCFERVGGSRSLRFEGRIVATSSADLPELIARGSFREDLYWRLDVVHLTVPPLRDRPEDVAPLALAACAEMGAGGVRPTREGLVFLERQLWPGNVRQLRNVLERAAALSGAARLGPDELEAALEGTRASPDRAIAELAEHALKLGEIEALYIQRVLQQTGGRIGKAADILGIHRKTLLEKRKRHGLS